MNAVQNAWQYCMAASKEPKTLKEFVTLGNFINSSDAVFSYLTNDTDYGYTIETEESFTFVVRETRGLFDDKGKFKPKAWISDLKTCTEKETGIGTLHHGFFDGWTLFENEVLKKVSILPKDKPVRCYGYSRGAAVVTVAACHIGKMRPCENINFGSPRVGMSDFRDIYQRLPIYTTRAVYGNDLVTMLPPAIWGFRHVGTELKYKQSVLSTVLDFFGDCAADHTRYNSAVYKNEFVKN